MPTESRKYGLAIFDCDGVLVDGEDLSVGIIIRLMSELGVKMTAKDVNRLSQGLTDRDMWRKFEHEYEVTIPHELTTRYNREELALLRTGVHAVEGVESAIRSFGHHDQPICVASSGPQAKLAVTLGVTGLGSYFHGDVFSASQVENGKPAPDLFSFAARSMGVTPERCVVIEDSRNGILAGLAAGMTVLAFAPDNSIAQVDDLGVPLFGSMSELPRLLGH